MSAGRRFFYPLKQIQKHDGSAFPQREQFLAQVSALDRTVQNMAIERMEQRQQSVEPPPAPQLSTTPTSPPETAVVRPQALVLPQEATTSQPEPELVPKVEPESCESPVAIAHQSDQQVSRVVSPVGEILNPRPCPVQPWLTSLEQVGEIAPQKDSTLEMNVEPSRMFFRSRRRLRF